MKVTRVAHISVNVEARLAEVRDFYTEVLGLEDRARPEIPGVAGHWFGVGASELHLVDAPCTGSGIDPTGPHFCVYVDDLDAAVAELEVQGVNYFRGAQGDVAQIWVVDPAGNTVELQQEPGTAP